MEHYSWRHIDIFHAVMTTKSLTDAAQLLHTSQPTVSRELARFEKILGFRVFDRIKGRLHPTEQGLRLFEEVERSYYGLERISRAAESIRQFQHAQLAITCLPAFAQSLLPAVCRTFHAQYPDVNFEIAPQESPLLEEWLSAQRYDLGITEHQLTPPGTLQETLLTLSEVCVLPESHPLCSKSVLTPADFAQQNFISLSVADSYRQKIDTLFSEKQIPRRMIMETHSAASVCAMVREGLGVSVVNPLTAMDCSGICVRPFSEDIPFTVSLIRPLHRPHSVLTDIFITHLRQHMQSVLRQLKRVTG